MRSIRCAAAGGLAISLLLIPISSALADGNDLVRGILGALLNGAAIANAQKSWQGVNQDVQYCLTSRYNISPANLAQQGITATDQRVTPYIQSCEQLIAQARQQQEQQVRQAQAQAQAAEAARAQQAAEMDAARRSQEAAAEEARRFQEAAAAEARRAVAAAEAAAKAQREARRTALVNKYGSAMADAILAGQIRRGMTKEEVVAARGQPDRMQTVPPSDELWVYGSDRVILTDGKVMQIGQ